MPLRPKEFHTEPFIGAYSGIPKTPWDHRFVYRAYNMAPYQGSYRPRAADSPFQVTSANSTPQWTGIFLLANGTRLDLAIIAGQIWQQTALGVWTLTVTTANFATATTTISTTARIYAVNYNNTMVFSDGVNVPFTWNGVAGAGGIVPLTNAPVAFGAPTVYYGKLFFILLSDRRIIRWSEENAANTGYIAGGYTNTWTLGQTAEAGPLTAIRGTNAGLYYWREVGIGVITGAVGPDFVTTGVHDAVSSVVGTTAPGSVCLSGRALWFTDRFGRPWRLPLGGVPEPVWEQLSELFIGSDAPGTGQVPHFKTTDIALSMSVPFGFYDGVLVVLKEPTPSFLSLGLLFSNEGQYLGEWTWADSTKARIYPTVIGECYDDGQGIYPVSGIRALFAQQGNQTGVYAFGCPNTEVQWGLGAGGTPDAYYVILGPFGDGSALYLWSLVAVGVDVGTRDTSSLPSITLSLTLNTTERLGTPNGTAALGATITFSTTVHQDVRLAYGIEQENRFLQAKVAISAIAAGSLGRGEIGIRRCDVTAYPVPMDPAQP